MDFAQVLADIARFLSGEGVRFGLAGAFALQAHGLARATSDLDFVVEAAAQPALLRYLDSLGYERLHVSEGFSNHLHAEPSRGRLDFIYVDDHTADLLFGGGTRVVIFPGLEVPVPRPEHLAAMKVQAMKSDPSRTFKDLADIQFLLGLPGIDAAEIRGYFEKQGLLERFNELEKAVAARLPGQPR